jgi:hypothetical protein
MIQINDAKRKHLINLGIPEGDMMTMTKAWLISLGANPAKKALPDLWYNFFTEVRGDSGALPDMKYRWLKTLGYTGALSDMWSQYWAVDPYPFPTDSVIKYFDFEDGSDTTGDGSFSNPWKTIAHATGELTDDDTAISISPSTEIAATHASMEGGKIFSLTKYGSVIKSEGGTRTLFIGGSSDGYGYVTGFHIDCSTATYATTKMLDVSSTSNLLGLFVTSCKFTGNPSSFAVSTAVQYGFDVIDDCEFIFDDFNQAIYGGSLLNQVFNHTLKILNSRIDLAGSPAGADVILGRPVDAGSNYGWIMYIEDNNFKIDLDISKQFNILSFIEGDYIEIKNNFVELDNPANNQCTVFFPISTPEYDGCEVKIENNVIKSNSPNGYLMGMSSHCTGYVKDCAVQAEYFASNTPHGITLRYGTASNTQKAYDNVAGDIYVGYIVSSSATAASTEIYDNLAMDCYGPSFYAKGNTDATIRDNRAVVSTKHTQRNQGILHATKQDSDLNDDTQFTDNVVTVQSDSIGAGGDVFALAGISTDQTLGDSDATFTGNVYRVPDTVATDAEVFSLFGEYKTLTEWNAHGSNNDTITYHPQADIDAWVAEARAEFDTAVKKKRNNTVPID